MFSGVSICTGTKKKKKDQERYDVCKAVKKENHETPEKDRLTMPSILVMHGVWASKAEIWKMRETIRQTNKLDKGTTAEILR